MTTEKTILAGGCFWGVQDLIRKRAGVIWQPSYEQSYYAAYGTSFNPSAEQLSEIVGTLRMNPIMSRVEAFV